MFLRPTPAFMYLASAALAFGDAILWTARGEFIYLQSNSERLVSRNTGIFTCLYQCRYILYRTYISVNVLKFKVQIYSFIVYFLEIFTYLSLGKERHMCHPKCAKRCLQFYPSLPLLDTELPKWLIPKLMSIFAVTRRHNTICYNEFCPLFF